MKYVEDNTISTDMKSPYLTFERPTSHYLGNEGFSVVMLPADGGVFDVMFGPQSAKGEKPKLIIEGNRVIVKPPLSRGDYFLKARWKSFGGTSWSAWSAPLRLVIHDPDENIWPILEADHRISLMIERGVNEVITLIDPEAEPPGKAGLVRPRWFATPVYEGCTPLVNEEPAYYQDPLAYYFDCIDQLIDLGSGFVTWHDVIDGNYNKSSLEVLLQFDVDGGRRSMLRVYEGLAERGIRASLMLHRRGHHWYPYELDVNDLAWIKKAEDSGWTIGYHNNALSQVLGESVFDPGNDDLKKASLVFADDVHTLNQHFAIRTFTHHGGNVYNVKVVPPDDLEITGVDRVISPQLWESIKTMFSDGGFISRPCSLSNKIKSLTPGLHFFRNHPFKYGNYNAPVDVPPRFESDLSEIGLSTGQDVIEWKKREIDKERRWLKHRQACRSKTRLAYLRLKKPLSSRFSPYQQLEDRINAFRKRRRETFLRLYPWAEGDPRVFWWRLLEAWAPKKGEILNVGALPPDQKDENLAFLSSEVSLKDMDIDSKRCPDYEMDICNAPSSLNNRFTGTLLFGLPYFSSPSAAVAACARVTESDGIGLFGFVADTHPARGSVFHPEKRHLWRRDKEPLSNIGLNGNLWAFDQDSLPEIFRDWRSIEIEGMGHYWFVVAHK